MQKYIVILKLSEKAFHRFGKNYERFNDYIRNDMLPLFSRLEIPRLKVFVTAEKPPGWNLFRFQNKPFAMFHIWASAEVWGSAFEQVENAFDGKSFCLKVDETNPVVYQKNWEDGVPTTVPMAVTLLRRKKGMDPKGFVSYWKKVYSPLALSIIPIWYYERNEVLKDEHYPSHNIDGIVAETCSTKKELLNPFKFFGGFWRLIPNLIKINRGVNSFLELKDLEVYYMEETWIRS